MFDSPYLKKLRIYIERRCIGGSVTRNQGKAGLNKQLRSLVGAIDLSPLTAISTSADFQKWLGQHTSHLVELLEKSHDLKWGTARKVLNIWLRDLTYNGDIAKAHELATSRPFLEIPLDSRSAKYLRDRSTGKPTLPRWPGIKHLTSSVSAEYQKAATDLHITHGQWAPHRVDLDVDAWVPED